MRGKCLPAKPDHQKREKNPGVTVWARYFPWETGQSQELASQPLDPTAGPPGSVKTPILKTNIDNGYSVPT